MLITWNFYFWFTWTWIAVGVITFLYLLRTTAPYGRHTSTSWGPLIDNRLGWFIMEFFVLVVLSFFILTGTKPLTLVTGIFAGFFALHYINRSIIFPLRLKTNGKKMPLVITLSAMFFNLINGFLIGYFLANFADYDSSWLSDPRFIGGTLLFFGGMYINWSADARLIRLRKPGETGYKIPHGWLFERISCPNLFGEILEWAGFAILTWSLPGLTFFIWTVANLLPRALSHHRWYHEKFPDYPAERKAVLPYMI
jgi:hypothetical protein